MTNAEKLRLAETDLAMLRFRKAYPLTVTLPDGEHILTIDQHGIVEATLLDYIEGLRAQL